MVGSNALVTARLGIVTGKPSGYPASASSFLAAAVSWGWASSSPGSWAPPPLGLNTWAVGCPEPRRKVSASLVRSNAMLIALRTRTSPSGSATSPARSARIRLATAVAFTEVIRMPLSFRGCSWVKSTLPALSSPACRALVTAERSVITRTFTVSNG